MPLERPGSDVLPESPENGRGGIFGRARILDRYVGVSEVDRFPLFPDLREGL